MKRNFLRRKTVSFGLLAILAAATAAEAQQQMNVLMTSMAANASQLKQYTFKQRTETYLRGELKKTRLAEIHYDASGERVSIPLGEQQAQPEPRRRGPGSRIVAKKIEEKQEEMKEYIERLIALTSRYLAHDPAKLQAAVANAEVTTVGSSNQVRVMMRNYVKTGDTMTMSFDSASKRPTKTEISTSLDDSPVSIVLSFDQIREGPNYPEKMVVVCDAKQLEVRVFTYDYRM